ncbi:hypothetical protein FRC03_008355 [Tulasnella sp. 419]|nr:hypothetical protein FRC03_008355 [Tulasnella sp. 419]
MKTVRNESVFALYKGASPPAVAWALTDSILMGSLYNYRLFLLNHGGSGIVESYFDTSERTERKRLSILGHAIAGLFAGWTR